MTFLKEMCFVLDENGNRLSPTNKKKAGYLIRKGRAVQNNKFPMVIQLVRAIPGDMIDKTPIHLGIDDGSKHIGLALVQECKTKNKVVFKGTVEQRQDVKYLMDARRSYRQYKRSHKRYRKKRFRNRTSLKRKGRITPTIKQKREAALRTIKKLQSWCRIDVIHLEDVKIDVSSLVAGEKLYKWQYQKSTRLDENLRKATILRDNCTCQKCGKKNCRLEAHHITPKRLKGADSIHNLITLCKDCHSDVTGHEMKYAEKFYARIKGRNVYSRDAAHVMQGKTYLRTELSKIAPLVLTTGGDTANKRIDWDIEKTHSNDAIVICSLEVNVRHCELKNWQIKPMRKKSQAKTESVGGFKHRDFIRYTKKNGDQYIGYITVLNPVRKTFDMRTSDGKILKKYGVKSAELIWRFNKMYWF